MDELVAQYVTWMRSWGASERTVDARQTMAKSRVKAWGLEGFTEANISEYLARPDLSKWTRSTYHAHLSCFCSWLAAAGYLDANPMEAIRKPKRPHSKPRPLSEAEVARVLSAVRGQTRDWISLALLCGLRASEIAKIRGEDVQEDGIYVEGKGGTREVLPCHPDLWAMAQRYPRYGYWFPGNDHGHIRGQHISLTVGRLFHSLGIEGSIHRCRHVYGTRLMRTGTHIRTVQKLMRHANLDTTANYTAVDENEMRSAVLLLGSINPPPLDETG